MFRNVGSQKVAVFAWDNANGIAKTGDAANITAQISIDGGVSAATDDTNPTELDATDHPGTYLFDTTQAETNGDLIIITAVSSTDDIDIKPVFIYTTTVMRGTDNAALASVCTETRLAELDAANLPTDISNLNNISVADIIAGVADGSYDFQEMMRIIFSACACITTGGGTTTVKSRDSADSKDRITMTVDTNGNRSVVVLDGS